MMFGLGFLEIIVIIIIMILLINPEEFTKIIKKVWSSLWSITTFYYTVDEINNKSYKPKKIWETNNIYQTIS